MSRKPAFALSLLILTMIAAGSAGCGGGEKGDRFEGERREVAAVVEALSDAAAAGDGARICEELLAESLTNGFRTSGADCGRAVTQGLRGVGETELSVLQVSVTGSTARARVSFRRPASATARGAARETRTLELVDERKRWRISSLG